MPSSQWSQWSNWQWWHPHWQSNGRQWSIHASAESASRRGCVHSPHDEPQRRGDGWGYYPSSVTYKYGPPPTAAPAQTTAASAHVTTASYTGYLPTSATITSTVSVRTDPAKFTPPTRGPPPDFFAEYMHHPVRKVFNCMPAILSASEWHGSPRMNVRDIEEVRKELNANLIRAEKKHLEAMKEGKLIRPPYRGRPSH